MELPDNEGNPKHGWAWEQDLKFGFTVRIFGVQPVVQLTFKEFENAWMDMFPEN